MASGKFTDAKDSPLSAADRGIIERVRQIRISRFGPRGQTHFAQALGIRSSTYHYYEHTRVPPSPLLVEMARIARVDLVWLMTGEGASEVLDGSPALPGTEVVRRAADLLERRPGAGRAMAAFVELLENVEAVDRRVRAADQPESRLRVGKKAPAHPAWRTRLESGRLIPVLGRAAAASPRFWTDIAEGESLTRQLDAAVEHLQAGKWSEAQARSMGALRVRGPVALVQLLEPTELAGLSVHEVLDSNALAKRWPDAFALRLDGDSMRPMLECNDLVVLSPHEPAVDGEPAIVQLAGQIGVVCKILRRVGKTVRLVPANEALATSVHAADEVAWALRVLARVRVK